jgi:1,4-dihydroxy-2-naphthoate octaprenyltransferase
VRTDDVVAFIKLGRPLFLGGGFVLYALGAVLAGTSIDWPRYALGQAAVTAFQLMTHYANDYFDYDADRANATPTAWSGGSRVLAEGVLPRRTALIAAIVLAAVGAGVSIALVRAGGALIAPTLIAIAVLSWEYSAPPLRLCGRGLGELDTAIVVTGLVPWLAWYLQTGRITGVGALVTATAPLACLQAAMLIAIELPDAAGDAATGKRTLVVRLGAAAAAKLYVALLLAAYALLAIGLARLPWPIVVGGAATLPIASWRVARIGEAYDPAAWERLGFWSVALLVGTAAGELAAAVALRVR